MKKSFKNAFCFSFLLVSLTFLFSSCVIVNDSSSSPRYYEFWFENNTSNNIGDWAVADIRYVTTNDSYYYYHCDDYSVKEINRNCRSGIVDIPAGIQVYPLWRYARENTWYAYKNAKDEYYVVTMDRNIMFRLFDNSNNNEYVNRSAQVNTDGNSFVLIDSDGTEYYPVPVDFDIQ